VDNFIIIGKGEEYSGGRSKKALLADCMEAIFGACYLDAGFKSAQEFIQTLLVPVIESVLQNKHRRDYKTLLQEYVQKTYKTYPAYELIKRTGPETKHLLRAVTSKKKRRGPIGNKKRKQNITRQDAYEQLGLNKNFNAGRSVPYNN
jgi:ribonuclease-3